jgi:hypothetical protein
MVGRKQMLLGVTGRNCHISWGSRKDSRLGVAVQTCISSYLEGRERRIIVQGQPLGKKS